MGSVRAPGWLARSSLFCFCGTTSQLRIDQLLAMLIKVCFTEIPTRLGIQMVTEWDAEAPVEADEETLASSLQTPRVFDYAKSPVHEIVRSCVMIVGDGSGEPLVDVEYLVEHVVFVCSQAVREPFVLAQQSSRRVHLCQRPKTVEPSRVERWRQMD